MLVRAVTAWLVQRRSDVTITVTALDGREVSVNAKRVADPEKLVDLTAVQANLAGLAVGTGPGGRVLGSAG